ncbi:MAG TPA: RidA family protein, partial [Pseudonocardiaceae bacterium]|nr:RidA family protein [Pseudonocardiaceae bacterium]
MNATPTVRFIRSDDQLAATPYSYTAVVPASATLVLAAGACPLDADGTVVAPGDVAAQTEQTIANLRIALAAAGAGLGDIVRTTIYVASGDRGDLVTAWRVVTAALGAHEPPSTLLGVAVLGYPD